jgi:hypothetical protein
MTPFWIELEVGVPLPSGLHRRNRAFVLACNFDRAVHGYTLFSSVGTHHRRVPEPVALGYRVLDFEI